MSRALLVAIVLVGSILLFARGELTPGPSPAAPGVHAANGGVERDPTVAPRDVRAARAPGVAPENERPDDDPRYRVRVTSRSGQAIPGARVALRRDDAILELGETGRNGTLSEPVARVAWDDVVATAAGFAPSYRRLQPDVSAGESAGEVVLVLQRAAEIRGTVLRPDETPFTAGATVVAIPSGILRAFLQRSPTAALEDPEVEVVTADENGEFRLVAIDPGRPYTLLAAAPGWAAPELVRDVLPGADRVAIPVRPIHALRLELLDSDGGPARLSGSFGPRGGARTSLAAPGAEPFQGPRLAAWLAGVPLEVLERDDASTRLFLAHASIEVAEVRPLRFSVHPPGYGPFEVELGIPRLIDGVPVERFVLHREAQALGALELAVKVGSRHDLRVLDPFALVVLDRVPTESPDDRARYAIPWSEAAGWIAPHVPAGEYDVRVEVRPGLWRSPPERVLVEEGATSRVTFGPEDCGAVEAIVTRADGRPWDGELRLWIGAPRNPSSAPDQPMPTDAVNFARPPYVLPIVAAGPKVFGLAGPEGIEWRPVEVRAGSIARVELVVR